MRNAQLRQLGKWIVLVLVITLLPIIGYTIYNTVSCGAAIYGFEKSIKDIALGLNSGENSNKEFNKPCAVDTIYFIEEGADKKKFEQYPQIIEAINSKSQPINNVFLLEKSKVKRSFHVAQLNTPSNYMCFDISGGRINISFEKSEKELSLINLDASTNCGQTEVIQEIISEEIFALINSTQDSISENFPQNYVAQQLNSLENSEITREIICLDDKTSIVEVQITSMPGKRLKSPAYIEVIDKDCLKKIGVKNSSVGISPSVNGISDITGFMIYARKDPIVYWNLKDYSIEDNPAVLTYTADMCLRKCAHNGIHGILLVEKVFNLNIEDEISYLETRIESKKSLDTIKSFVAKGEFEKALNEIEKIRTSIRNPDTLQHLDDLSLEIENMQKHASIVGNETKSNEITVVSG